MSSHINITSNSTIQLKKTNKNSLQGSRRRHCSLVRRNHFCHQTKVSFKERSLIHLRKFRKILVCFLMKEELVLLIFKRKFRGPEISVVCLIVCSRVLVLIMK